MLTVNTNCGSMTIVGDRFIDMAGTVRHLTAIPSLPTEDQEVLEMAFKSNPPTDWTACSNDENPSVRLAVALHGKCLDTLSNDSSEDVRNCAIELNSVIPKTH